VIPQVLTIGIIYAIVIIVASAFTYSVWKNRQHMIQKQILLLPVASALY